MTARGLAIAILGLVILFTAPAGADEDAYAEIRELIEGCDVCHGENGAPDNPDFPILAGQHLYYLYVQLKDFKAGRRANEIMEVNVAELEKSQMLLLAQFYSEQTWPNIAFKADPERAARGRTATEAGQCVACHLGDFIGDSRIPRVAGQYPAYLEKTMLDFKTKARANSPAIATLLATYSDDDIAAMAEYMGGM